MILSNSKLLKICKSILEYLGTKPEFAFQKDGIEAL